MQIRLSDHFSFGRLLRFTLPSIAMMILTSLYSVADGLFVSNMVGDIGLSAVNIMFPVAMLIAAVGFMLGTGGSAVVARTLGEGRPDMANRFFSMFVFAVILFGGVLSAAGAAFVEPIARLAGASDILMDSCVSYGRILFAGSLPFMLQTSLQPFFVVAERPNMGLILSIASGVTNFVGDWVLIQLLGLPGAAWATAASQAISAVLCILYLRRKAPELIFARADCRMDGELLKQTAHFSFVTALHQLSLYIGKLLVQGAVNTGGTDMISAYTATTRIEGFANSFGDSGSAATSVLVAQNRGAGKEERVKESFRSSLFLMLAMGLAVPLIMYVSASTSVGFMLGTRSGAAFENARDYLKLVALFYTLCFTGNTFAGYFNGIGKVCVPFLGATSHIALRVVLSWLLVGKMGLPAVALATGLGWVLVNALCAFVKWRMEKKQKAAERNIM